MIGVVRVVGSSQHYSRFACALAWFNFLIYPQRQRRLKERIHSGMRTGINTECNTRSVMLAECKPTNRQFLEAGDQPPNQTENEGQDRVVPERLNKVGSIFHMISVSFVRRCVLALLFTAGCGTFQVNALQDSRPAAASRPTDQGWPRSYTDGTATLVLYQPQVDDWAGFATLNARFAAELIPSKGAQPQWGVVTVEAQTRVDLKSRTVAFSNWKITGMRYAGAQNRSQLTGWQNLTRKLLPQYPTVVAIERILSYMDKGKLKVGETAVRLEPPPILVSTQPAFLVIIDGPPIAVDLENTKLQKIVNTNWDLFLDKEAKRYYLRKDRSWLSAKQLTGQWTPVTNLPKSFAGFPDNALYKDIRQAAAHPEKDVTRSVVFVVDKPQELIVIAGEPSLQQIPGTHLMWVNNTESDLFFQKDTQKFFFLSSGRWFSTSGLKAGAWSIASNSLPDDFKKIPPHHPRGRVLASVPGTPEANEALLAAAIPQKATISRHSVTAKAEYVGNPEFEAIPGTRISYARNTPNDILKIAQHYFMCLRGVWFMSSAANGPWMPADSIPTEIYTIPPSSPKYNLTFVRVYNSTAKTITYGYTAGYLGAYIAHGVPMWGTGYTYSSYASGINSPHPVYWTCPNYTYGSSAWYNPATGIYLRGSAFYGPYGGYARAAVYNPATSQYQWGSSAWAGYGAAALGGFYDAEAGGWAEPNNASDIYQSWRQSLVEPENESARTGSQPDSHAMAAVSAPQTSRGGMPIGVLASQNAAANGNADVYAGKDGNVYRREASGQWDRNNGQSWQAMQQTAWNETVQSLPPAEAQPAVVQSSLNHDAAARAQGNLDAQQSESMRKNKNWTAGGWVEPLSTGWSARYSW